MANKLFIVFFFVSFFLGGNAWAECGYEPGKGNNPALHDVAAAIPAEFQRTLELPAGTAVRTDSGTSSALKDVGCLKKAHVVIYDRRDVDGNGYVSKGYLTGCLNRVEFAPVFVGVIYTDEDWIKAFIAASTQIEDLMGPCDGSVSWKYLPDGRVVIYDPILDDNCQCADKVYVPANRPGEEKLDDLFVARIGQTPLEGTIKLARQALQNADPSKKEAPPATPTRDDEGEADIVRGGSATPLTPADFVSRVLSLWSDNDRTGLADHVDNSRWSSEGIVTWYHTGDCEETPRFAGAVGGAVWAFGTSHVVVGADLEVGIQQNDWRILAGATGGADVMSGTWGIVPHVGPEFRVLDRKVDIWVGGDVVGGFGPDWIALGATGSLAVEGQVSPSISLGARAWAGGMGGISGCNSGSLFGIRAGVTWKFPGN